ncbi:MAG: helix-turn-helix domain-containing protein [Bacteroidia bacterium]|nr:helix-turn-helix domain-containing protein [Bacteroidia bacterium]
MGQIRNDALLKAIGIAFKVLREEKVLTQEEVYNDTGVHIGRIETAQSNPTISTIHSLCMYYGISLENFFERLNWD